MAEKGRERERGEKKKKKRGGDCQTLCPIQLQGRKGKKRRPTKEGKKGGKEPREREAEAEAERGVRVWVAQSVDAMGDGVDGVPLMMGDSLRCWARRWLAQLQDASAERAREGGDPGKRQQKHPIPSFLRV